MRKKILTFFGILIFTPVIMVLLIYLGLAWYYAKTYMNGVMINGVYAAGMTPEEVNDILLQKTEAASFTVTDKYGQNYDIPIQDMDFSYSYLNELTRIQKKQNPLQWGLNLYNGTSETLEITPEGRCDKEKLHDYLLSMELIKNQADPKKVRVEIVLGKNGYELVDETQNLLDVERATGSIEAAVLSGERALNLDASGCYIEMEYTSKMKNTLALWEKVSRMQKPQILCSFYDGDETVDAAVISEWIALDENGEFILDENGELTLSEEAVEQYVAGIAKRHDTADGPWHFNPTRGGQVTIEKGNYGYKLNQKKQKELLMELVYAHKSAKQEVIYSQRGYGNDAGDIGSTYIEVDMTNQMLYYYQNGTLKLSTPVVTGNTSRGDGTPQRVCYVYYKQRNRTLIGEDYRTPVSYWMAVYGNIGIHDANWRGKFGGSIYKTNGSHGCINTPAKEVARLYEMAEEGTPVVMFY